MQKGPHTQWDIRYHTWWSTSKSSPFWTQLPSAALRISIIFDTFGLFSFSGCTHSKAMLMHCFTSWVCSSGDVYLDDLSNLFLQLLSTYTIAYIISGLEWWYIWRRSVSSSYFLCEVLEICFGALAIVWIVIPAAFEYLYDYDTQTEYICFLWDYAPVYVFWCHVSPAVDIKSLRCGKHNRDHTKKANGICCGV